MQIIVIKMCKNTPHCLSPSEEAWYGKYAAYWDTSYKVYIIEKTDYDQFTECFMLLFLHIKVYYQLMHKIID
jgi:hypothetical protein